ncbi:MAG: isocitrate/isopropylmalate family dehydrogenase [Candidatus Eisenbacteria bacterium]
MVGGLGMAAGANFGDDHAMFEAVHGTAPDIAGQGIANPLAVMLAGVLMLGISGWSRVDSAPQRIHEVLAKSASGRRTGWKRQHGPVHRRDHPPSPLEGAEKPLVVP